MRKILEIPPLTGLAVLLGLCALAVIFTTLYVLAVSHWHGPFRDMWEIYPFLIKIIDSTWTWQDLWESYGYAHRLLIPRLLYIADYQLVDASNHLLIAVSIFCQLTISFLFFRKIVSVQTLPFWQKWCVFFMVICFQMSGTLLFNFMHTFDVQWFLCCCFVSIAFYVLSLCDDKNFSHVWISAFLIACGCLCNFSAMAAWPIWLLLCFGRGRLERYKVVLLLVILVFIMAYAVGMRGQSSLIFEINNLPRLIIYLLIQFPLLYLSNPFSNPDYLPLGSWATIPTFLMLVAMARFWWNWLQKKSVELASIFFAALMLFGLGVALITSLGRGYDPSHVEAMRYQNITLLFWSASVAFCFSEASLYGRTSLLLRKVPAAFVFVALLACQWQSWNENLLLGRNVSRSHLALMMGYSSDIPMISATVSRSMIYVLGYSLEKERLLHEQARKGIFHGAIADDWLMGVSTSRIHQVCKNVSRQISEKVTPYTRYQEFLVSGDLSRYSYALLVNGESKVIAIAIPEKNARLEYVYDSIESAAQQRFRGYSLSDTLEGSSLILRAGGSMEASCYMPYNQGGI